MAIVIAILATYISLVSATCEHFLNNTPAEQSSIIPPEHSAQFKVTNVAPCKNTTPVKFLITTPPILEKAFKI